MSKEIKLLYGDIEVYNGDPVIIQGTDKLVQDLAKIVLTELGGEFHPDYGCDIYEIIGRYEDATVLESIAKKAILRSLSYFNNIQFVQSGEQAQSPKELLTKIKSVTIQKINPTDYLLNITIIDGSGETVNIQTGL